MAADLEFQNCFAHCEHFYCVQVSLRDWGYLLSKIDSEEKLKQVVQWVKEAKKQGELKLPPALKDHVIKVGQVEKTK